MLTHIHRGIYIVCLILPGFAANTAAADPGDYETPPLIDAADILNEQLRQGEYHRIGDDVRNDGYLNYYMIHSDYGDFEAAGTSMLRIRIREIGALAQLDELSRTEVFIKAAADAGVRQVRTVTQFATRPIQTLTGIPAGIGRMFTRYKREADEGLDAAKDYVAGDDQSSDSSNGQSATVGETATSLAESYLGVSGSERAWHRKLGTDPYTSNEPLRKSVKNIAWADRLGRFGIKFAGVPRIPGVDILGDVNEAVWSKNPYELQDLNRGRLQAAGADQALIDAFFDNPVLSPTRQTCLIAAIADLAPAGGRDGIARQSLNVRSEAEAGFFVESSVLLAWYHRNETPVAVVSAAMTVPVGVKADNGTVTLLAADRLYWNESIAIAARQHRSMRTESGTEQTHELWLTGDLSSRARRELENLGWDIHANLTIMISSESTESQ